MVRTRRTPRASTGPDLRQLFLGSEGTLGVVTEVGFSVRPLPEASRGQAFHFEGFESGLEAVHRILHRGWRPPVELFVEEYGVTYTILHDPQMRGMELYQVPGLPATFLIDREGTLRWIRYGPILEGDLDFTGALRELLS